MLELRERDQAGEEKMRRLGEGMRERVEAETAAKKKEMAAKKERVRLSSFPQLQYMLT